MTLSRLGRYLPALIWTCLLIVASSGWMSTGSTGGLLEKLVLGLGLPLDTEFLEGLHHYLRKLGHFSAYALLAFLWDRALRPVWPRWGYIAVFVICASVASWDEWHQSLLPDRTGSPADVALDVLGASLVILFRSWWLVAGGSWLKAQNAHEKPPESV